MTLGKLTLPLLTIDELAAYLQVPVATVRTWRVRGGGPPGYRVGKHVRYRRDDVDTWLEQCADAQGKRRHGDHAGAVTPAGARKEKPA